MRQRNPKNAVSSYCVGHLCLEWSLPLRVACYIYNEVKLRNNTILGFVQTSVLHSDRSKLEVFCKRGFKSKSKEIYARIQQMGYNGKISPYITAVLGTLIGSHWVYFPPIEADRRKVSVMPWVFTSRRMLSSVRSSSLWFTLGYQERFLVSQYQFQICLWGHNSLLDTKFPPWCTEQSLWNLLLFSCSSECSLCASHCPAY